MIWTVVEIHLRRLRHSPADWVLTFVVPIAFFTVFALIFTRGVGSTPRVKVALVNECDREAKTAAASDRVIASLRDNGGLRVVSMKDDATTVDRAEAEQLVRRGSATIAIVLMEGTSGTSGLSAELLNDASDQVASQVVMALVTRSIMESMTPNETPPSGSVKPSQNESAVAPVTEKMKFSDFFESGTSATDGSDGDGSGSAERQPDVQRPPEIQVTNLMGEGKSNPVVSVYAAGIAVMFLLFGATNGGGVLLEERENQTLERLLSSRMTMDHLLLGKWCYLTLLGFVQVTVMFVWAQLVFGLELLGKLDGFAMMTLVTSAAAASFGLFLATLCTTRGQLNGLSVVLVLTMSALGGSMVPRYVMNEQLRDAGLWTFNAWALDGYDKVFWRELPPNELGPQLAVLIGTAFALLVMARLLALRWEKA